jgi:hypothetical protein
MWETVIPDEPRMRSGSWDDSGSAGGHVGNPESSVSHRRLDQSQRAVSSEESWYSGGSDQELSSGDESEKHGLSVTK